MQAESKLHDEVVKVYKVVKLLCAQYKVGHKDMRSWMDTIHAFDPYGHGEIATDQVPIAAWHALPCSYGFTRCGSVAAQLLMCRARVPNGLQVDDVLEFLEFHLDEDLSYKLHWHLQEGGGHMDITDFVEYMCLQHVRILEAKQDDTASDQLADNPNSSKTTFNNPMGTAMT